MSGSYPNDADGDALRNAAESGADMSLPMVIDFSVDVPDEYTARRVAEIVATHGFDPSIYEDHDSGSWNVYCSKSMLATYDGVVAVQAQLNELLSPHGGSCDGWGTFGNTQK
jgi:Regulator of ribonuclease activity B